MTQDNIEVACHTDMEQIYEALVVNQQMFNSPNAVYYV